MKHFSISVEDGQQIALGNDRYRDLDAACGAAARTALQIVGDEFGEGFRNRVVTCGVQDHEDPAASRRIKITVLVEVA